MNLFQLVALILLGFFYIKHLVSLRHQPLIKVIYGLRWLVLISITVFFIGFPGVSQKFADFFGIKYGANFVIYTALIWVLFTLHKQSIEIRKLKERLEMLVSKLALDESKDAKDK